MTLATRDELKRIQAEVADLGGRPMSAETKARFERLLQRGNDLLERTEAVAREERLAADIAAIAAAAGRPSVGADGDGLRDLFARGWEAKAGTLYAPGPVSGGPVEMWPLEALVGEIPTDPAEADTAAFYKTVRAIAQPSYARAFRRFVQNVAAYRDEGLALKQLPPDEQKALSEGIDTAGGFAVPADLQAPFLERLAEISFFRRYARIVPTTRDRVSVPRLQPNGTSPSVYTSGWVASWVGEVPSFSDIDPTAGLVEVSVFKARAQTRISRDLAGDAPDLLAFLAVDGGENLALVQDRAFLAGSGVLQPLGLLSGGATTVDIEGTTADTISNTTVDLGSASKISDMFFALPDQYARRAVWISHRLTEGKIRKLVDGQDHYLWPLPNDEVFGDERPLLTRPVWNSSAMPQDGTNGNKALAFGDLRGYVIADRRLVSVRVLHETFADTDQIGFVVLARAGGVLANPDAVRIGVV